MKFEWNFSVKLIYFIYLHTFKFKVILNMETSARNFFKVGGFIVSGWTFSEMDVLLRRWQI